MFNPFTTSFLGECGSEGVSLGNTFLGGHFTSEKSRMKDDNKRSESESNTLQYFSIPDVFSFIFQAPANKRRSNQNQNDFEMVDSIDKQLPATEVFPQVEREEENNLPPLETVSTILDFWISLSWWNGNFDSQIVFH